jgi:hypothetical protein
MKLLLLALGMFVGATLGLVLIVCSAWFVSSYIVGGKSAEGTFMLSTLLAFLFVPALLACPIVGIVAGIAVYRRHAAPGDPTEPARRKPVFEIAVALAMIGVAVWLAYEGAYWLYIGAFVAGGVLFLARTRV